MGQKIVYEPLKVELFDGTTFVVRFEPNPALKHSPSSSWRQETIESIETHVNTGSGEVFMPFEGEDIFAIFENKQDFQSFYREVIFIFFPEEKQQRYWWILSKEQTSQVAEEFSISDLENIEVDAVFQGYLLPNGKFLLVHKYMGEGQLYNSKEDYDFLDKELRF